MESIFGTTPDVVTMDVQPLKDEFCRVMDSITRTNNLSGLAELAKRAGDLWWEMTSRGVEFKGEGSMFPVAPKTQHGGGFPKS